MASAATCSGYGGEQAPACSSSARIPRIIWMLWFQGWEKAPYVGRQCKKSFELWNPGWELRALSEADLPAVLGPYCDEFSSICEAMNPLTSMGLSWIPPAAAADLLRLFLLSRYGGVWADATILCRKPLDDWIHEAAEPAEGFFAYSPEKKDEVPVMSSFLAASPQHPIVDAWHRALREHWLRPKEEKPDLGYFWLHTLFGRVVKEDAAAKALWSRAPKVTGEYSVPGPHRFVPYEDVLVEPPKPDLKELVEGASGEPIYKMTIHDVKYDKSGRDVLLDRNGTAFPGSAHESAYSYILRRTLAQAAKALQSSEAPAEVWQPSPAELEAYREAYRLNIAGQSMMPG